MWEFVAGLIIGVCLTLFSRTFTRSKHIHDWKVVFTERPYWQSYNKKYTTKVQYHCIAYNCHATKVKELDGQWTVERLNEYSM